MIIKTLQLPEQVKAANAKLLNDVENLSIQLAQHKLYRSIKTIQDIRVYMEYQVWCVWDFMALLKSIQNYYLSSSISWVPPIDATIGFIIYSMLISEETDTTESAREHLSHFETYLLAMKQAGADREPIDQFVTALRRGLSIEDALALASPPDHSQDFVRTTIKIARGPIHGAVAAFCLSREGIIPDMFDTFVKQLNIKENISTFIWYLNQHIGVDTSSHGPQSAQLLQRVIGNDSQRCKECLAVTLDALRARLVFLDAILETLPSQKH